MLSLRVNGDAAVLQSAKSQPVVLKVKAGDKIEIMDNALGDLSPEAISAERSGSNLELFGNDKTQPEVILEDYYQFDDISLQGSNGQLYGYDDGYIKLHQSHIDPISIQAGTGEDTITPVQAALAQDFTPIVGGAAEDLPIAGAAVVGGAGAWGILGALGLLGGLAAAIHANNKNNSTSKGGDVSVSMPDTTPPALSVSLGRITADDIINAAESKQNIPVHGTVSGEYKVGDKVTVTVGGQSYTTTVGKNGSFEVSVPGSVLAKDNSITASVSSTDKAGNTGHASISHDYSVDTKTPSPTVTINDVTADNILNGKEAGGSVIVSGSVVGANPGDTVTITIGGKTHKTVVGNNGSFSLNLSGSELKDATSIKASVTTTNAAGNTGSGSTTHDYTVKLAAAAPVITIDKIAGDDIVTAAETNGFITISGKVTNANPGDTVVITTPDGKTYDALVGTNGTYKTSVPGSSLKNAAGQTAQVHASITTTDAAGNSASADADRSYTSKNTAPVAQPGNAQAVEDSGILSGSLNATDADGDALTYNLKIPVAGLTLNQNGTWSFDSSDPAYQKLKEGEKKVVKATYEVDDG
ncbi:Ig-like domain-containing protein, partial [Stenoxybacter acetivorans]|uniref:Ig-like domain-containing protein n=1 Tax=Stenoxybacter acetivorans TaxID=422441 RepID=UPI00056A2CB9